MHRLVYYVNLLPASPIVGVPTFRLHSALLWTRESSPITRLPPTDALCTAAQHQFAVPGHAQAAKSHHHHRRRTVGEIRMFMTLCAGDPSHVFGCTDSHTDVNYLYCVL